MKNKIEDRIKYVMSAVFEIPADEINNESSPDKIESWDSIKHMNLVVTLEEEFSIEIKEEKIAEMIDYSSIKHIITKELYG